MFLSDILTNLISRSFSSSFFKNLILWYISERQFDIIIPVILIILFGKVIIVKQKSDSMDVAQAMIKSSKIMVENRDYLSSLKNDADKGGLSGKGEKGK